MKTVFPEYRVRLEPVSAGTPAINPEDLGKRTKLGGDPDWLQGDSTPSCPDCAEAMSFVAQIDSIDYTGYPGKETYMFGDVGMLYLFYCTDCHEVVGFEQGG